MTDFKALGRGSYIELTTFRKTGEAVSNPVWLATDGDALVVITTEEAGKVKRVRHTPRVSMRRSDIRGKVKPGVEAIDGVVEIIGDSARQAQYVGMLRKKYGWQFRLAFGSAAKPGRGGQHVILRITPA